VAGEGGLEVKKLLTYLLRKCGVGRSGSLIGFLGVVLVMATGCSSGLLCAPRFVEESFVPGDPDAVVLFLPGGAPDEPDYYILFRDPETGVLTLTFPILPEEP
jgi:hypothetical protein